MRKVSEVKRARASVDSSYVGELWGVKGGLTQSEVNLNNMKSYDCDALVSMGGPGPRKLVENEKVVRLANDAEYKVLGAIGVGPMILAKAEVLKGKKATADPSVSDFMESKGCTFTGQPVQVDGKSVTAEGSKYAEQLANALIEALQ